MWSGAATMAPSVQKWPGAQVPAGASRPVSLQKWPGRHGVHSAAAWSRVAFENVPFGPASVSYTHLTLPTKA